MMFHISPVAVELLMHSHVSDEPFANYRSEFLRNAAITYLFERNLVKLSDKKENVFDTTPKGRELIRLITQIDVDDVLGDFIAKKPRIDEPMPAGHGPFITETFSIHRGTSDVFGPTGALGPNDTGLGTVVKHGLKEHDEMMEKRRTDRESQDRGEIPVPSTHPMLGG